MKKAVALSLTIIGIAIFPCYGMEITSIYPEIAYPGTPVTIIGGPFDSQVAVDLAGQKLQARRVSSRQLVFMVPELEAGEYPLYLRSGNKVSNQTLSLRIEQPPPAIIMLEPEFLESCSVDEERVVTVRGENIRPQAQLLFDGTVISFEWDDSQTMSFVPPVLKAGNYGVQIINSDGKSSLPYTLRINDRPEIDNVSQGDDFVNYYQVIISGTNFTSRSALLIKEYPGELSDMPPRQRFLNSRNDSSRQENHLRNSNAGNLIYQDCNTLIYNRYPPFRQDMRIEFQVSNPDGSQSSTYEAYLP